MLLTIKPYIKTLIGPRSNNEDSYLLQKIKNQTIACIADGVGGNECGEIASKFSIDLFLEIYTKTQVNTNLKDIVREIDRQVKVYPEKNPLCAGMATTFSACIIDQDILRGIHVGDSRISILRGNGIKQLTDEHTESARLLHEGKISKIEFANHFQRNILTSAIGSSNKLIVQNFEFLILKGDRIILSTDGFHEVIGKSTLRDLSLLHQNLDEFGDSVLDFLSRSTLKDNCTFMILELE
ncbi:MAG TPA: protein phosphatase 2C domain-containing protein [Aquella sp.]|nr:protein phosphatase 2C domain-containing protein [Aquella sp.]